MLSLYTKNRGIGETDPRLTSPQEPQEEAEADTPHDMPSMAEIDTHEPTIWRTADKETD